jgi:hypothetical protein
VMNGQRFFRSSPAVYSGVCAQLDAAYGYPNAETKTERTLPLVEWLPTDDAGRVYLAISAEHCEYILPSQMLPQMLAAGLVEEIDEAAYRAISPPPPPSLP